MARALKVVALTILTTASACSTTTTLQLPTVRDIHEDCVRDRTREISKRWFDYETRYNRRVIKPDWRNDCRHWAVYECLGGYSRKVYPPTCNALGRCTYD